MSKPQSTTFHIVGGGQRIRQNQDNNINLVTIEERQTTYVADAGCAGSDSFTNEIWGSDEDFCINCARSWAYNPDALTFKFVKA